MTFQSSGQAVYRDGQLVGLMNMPMDAHMVAEALNARERVLAAQGTFVGSPGHDPLPAVGTAEVPPASERLLLPSPPATCGRLGQHNCGVTGRWESHYSDEPTTGSYP